MIPRGEWTIAEQPRQKLMTIRGRSWTNVKPHAEWRQEDVPDICEGTGRTVLSAEVKRNCWEIAVPGRMSRVTSTLFLHQSLLPPYLPTISSVVHREVCSLYNGNFSVGQAIRSSGAFLMGKKTAPRCIPSILDLSKRATMKLLGRSVGRIRC
jgi:hypothetical protein